MHFLPIPHLQIYIKYLTNDNKWEIFFEFPILFYTISADLMYRVSLKSIEVIFDIGYKNNRYNVYKNTYFLNAKL